MIHACNGPASVGAQWRPSSSCAGPVLHPHSTTSTCKNPYVDEGFHIKRAGLVWNFDVNPGRFAHGKVLLYFWLGLFETGPETALPGLAAWAWASIH